MTKHKRISGYNSGEVINEYSKFMSELNRQGIHDNDIIVVCLDKDPRYIEFDIFY